MLYVNEEYKFSFEKIKEELIQASERGDDKYFYVSKDGLESLVLVSKYDTNYFKNMSEDDLFRISVR
jgi:hypothetical protein